MFRAAHPNSWWWTPDTDFLALILHTVQGANWQRSGAKGSPPKRIVRPDDRRPAARTAGELRDRRAAQQRELARRRAQREGKVNPLGG